VLAVRKIQRKPARRQEIEGVSANSFLVFIAVMLLMILAIVEADLHQEALKSMGIVFEPGSLDGRFVGP
jgi:hypothetical protein